MDNSLPHLIEPGIYTYLKYSLKKCHIFKCNYYNYILNISLFIVFVFMISILCVIHYKGTPTLDEIRFKNNKTKEYIMTKIYNYKVSQQRLHQELITALPHF
jgi:hypothetical protein